jgi:hypothetical protein
MNKPTEFQLRNFQQWIRDPIRRLSRQRHTGFSVAMITFPVLERWLRGKVGIKGRRLRGSDADQFYAELAVQFPVLRDPADGSFPHAAESFWQAFRNGILHQVAFSTKPIKARVNTQPPFCAFVERSAAPIVPTYSPPTFLLNPHAFAQAVLSIIEADFRSYEAADPEHHKLPFTTGRIVV